MFFSIIIPTLNEEKFLPLLLDSLVKQNVNNFEVILVDGNSSDRTIELAEKLNISNFEFKIIKLSQANLPKQRNSGAEIASGDWLVFIDADTIVMPNFTKRISEYILQSKSKIFTCWFMPDSNAPRDSILTLLINIIMEIFLLINKPLAVGPLTIVNKNLFHKVNGYDENHRYNEDIDFGLRVKKIGVKFDILRETLAKFSLRRIRKQGVLKITQQYTLSALPVLLFDKTLTNLPGYVMGGDLYNKKNKNEKNNKLQKLNKGIRNLFNDIFNID